MVIASVEPVIKTVKDRIKGTDLLFYCLYVRNVKFREHMIQLTI